VTGTLPVVNGGTGLSTLGTAGQALVVNSGATGLEYATIASDPTLATLTQTLIPYQSATLTLSSSTTTPVVSVTKEVPQPTVTNSQWVTSLDSNEMDVKNLAPATTLTPSATTGEITLTLGTGDFTGLVGVLVQVAHCNPRCELGEVGVAHRH
jgi:hypothetical protein